MAPDGSIGRYRRWYARLLRLYPRPFRERFAEPMTQTFTDLARERTAAGRGLTGFAVHAFADTMAGIMRENMTQLIQARNYLRWLVVTAAVLAVPAVAMALNLGIPDPDSGRGVVNWGPMDFALIGLLVLGAGLLFEYAGSRGASLADRAATGIAVVAGLVLVWVNLAVGMIGDEGNPANLLYLIVLVGAIAAATIARFQSRVASVAMFATAATHAVGATIALLAGLGPTLVADALFIGLWVASGMLFRRASLRSA